MFHVQIIFGRDAQAFGVGDVAVGAAGLWGLDHGHHVVSGLDLSSAGATTDRGGCLPAI